jgi:hypothetical protein
MAEYVEGPPIKSDDRDAPPTMPKVLRDSDDEVADSADTGIIGAPF